MVIKSTAARFARSLRSWFDSGHWKPYAAVALATVIVEFFVLNLWLGSLGIPFYYSRKGDALGHSMLLKTMADSGWIYTDRFLNAPFGAATYDYPTPSDLHLAIMRAMLFVIPKPAVVLNLYYLLAFPLSAMTALFALRRLGIAVEAASFGAVLFAFLPFRFYSNETHLFYSVYYVVPLICLTVVWIAQGRDFYRYDRAARWFARVRPTEVGWIAIASSAMISSDNPYFAFFSLCFFAFAATSAAFRYREAKTTIAAAALCAIVIAGLGFNVLPTLLYNATHREATLAFRRLPIETLLYSLTFVQLILPVAGHRFKPLADARAFFDNNAAGYVNENSAVSLGVIGSAGFLVLIGLLLFHRSDDRFPLLRQLAPLNLFAFLLATTGGLGAVVGFYIFGTYRAYNRIDPFIALFALAAAAAGAEIGFGWIRRVFGLMTARVALAVLLLCGIADQTTVADVPPYADNVLRFGSMDRFVREIEAKLPARASVLELPLVAYPEEGHTPPPGLVAGDEQAPYLHSHALAWSYGAIPGTAAGDFQDSLAKLDPARLVSTAALVDFDGLFVYRAAYPQNGAPFEARLAELTGSAPLVSDDGAQSFFDLTSVGQKLRHTLGPAALANARDAALFPITPSYDAGCSYLESAPSRSWHWCGDEASITIANRGSFSRTVTYSAVFQLGDARPADIDVSGDVARTTLHLPASADVPFRQRFVIAAHAAVHIVLHTDAASEVVPGELRPLVFQIANAGVDDGAAGVSSASLAAVADSIDSNGVAMSFGAGCSVREGSGASTWHWCGHTGSMDFVNSNATPKRVTVDLVLAAATPKVIDVRFRFQRLSHAFRAAPTGNHYRFTITVPAGTSQLLMDSQGPALVSPDVRTLVFRPFDVTISAR